MKRTVNFYRKLEPEKTVPRTTALIAVVWVSAVMIHIVWSFFLTAQLGEMNDKLAASKVANKKLQAEIALEGLKKNDGELKELGTELDALEIQRHRQQVLIARLRDPNFGNLSGFSNVLIGLAKQHKRGISIETVEVTSGGAKFFMAGKLRRPKDLPAYIVRLGHEKAFRDMTFEKVEIVEEAEELMFKVTSSPKI